ncbi:MAG TPA: GMC family oxidoreductase [Longimicrobiales bacterium]
MSSPRALTARERAILAAAMDAAMGGAFGADAAEAVQPFLDRLSAGDRTQLRLLLRMLEFVAPALMGRPRRFSRLNRERRERILTRWAASPLVPLRQGAAALKALAALGVYGRDAAWPDVGYDGPWLGRVDVAVHPAPSLSHPAPPTGGGPAPALQPGITLGRNADRDLRLRAEACVIGLGAGGAAALARLAEAGVDVIGIEAGGAPTAAEFDQRELDMLPLLYYEAGLRATADKAVGILQGRGVGGSTLHNTGLVYVPPRGILERWREEHGLALSAAEIDAHVAGVLDTLGAVPIPEEGINPANDALRRGAERLGWRYRVALHNRTACSGCGYCMLGCAYNRKSNAALTYVPRAVAAGAAVLADAAAVRIEGRAGARRVVCDLLDDAGRPTGRRATVDAKVILVAAGALATPALLRRSRLGDAWVGRGLRLHPAATVFAAFPDRIEAWRGVPQSVLIEEFADFFENGRGGFLLVANAATSPALTAVLAPGLGAGHRAILRDYPRLAAAAVLLHDETEGRVTVARDGRPIARYRPDAGDRRELLRGIHALARIYLAAGAERVHLPWVGAPAVRDEAELDAALRRARTDRHSLPLNSVHPQGSCPLDGRRDRGAVDPDGQVWDAPGVYVCDASIFPTSVGVPPQVTIMAMATAVADRARAG